MSLLMDALRKAEEAKRLAGENQAPAVASELTLTPLSAPAASPLPDLAKHLDALDSELSAVAVDAPPRRQAAAPNSPDAAQRETAKRSAARNVFAAKAPPESRRGLWLALSLGAVAALGLGGYFWWQLQAVSGVSLARAPQAPTAEAPLVATPAPAPTPAPTAAPAPAPSMAQTTMPPEMPRSAPSSALRTRPEPAIAPEPRARRVSPAANPIAPNGSLRLRKTQANPPLERAYEALQAGRLDEAQGDYEQVLRGDAKNTDALLGLATIAARQGQSELAQGYYLRAFEADPSDPTAQAGLINSRGQADPGQSESRLKGALASQPDSAALNFALGNLYARQARWSEAQQAYFRAYSGEPDNADYLFNLAVSLDHLRQNKLAAQYYQMALNPGPTDSRAQHGSFDRSQAKKRLLELQP